MEDFYHEFVWNHSPEGYDKQYFIKRARAFEIIFRSCARRVILQQAFGYGSLVAGTMNPTLKIFKSLISKIKNAQDAKAYYICMTSFYNFLYLIDYQVPEDYIILLGENND